jgi:FkbM family methyltransferase
MEAGTFEQEEVKLVRTLLPSVDLVVNVGANAGYYVCLCAQHGTPVVAFEPLPLNLRLLYRNLAANGWLDRAEILPLALADRIGVADLFGSQTGASLVAGWAGTTTVLHTPVPLNTLDAMIGHRLAGRQTLILVDIEGAELGMLRGAVGVLRQQPRPWWLVEICVDENQPGGRTINPHLSETFQLFWDLGYRTVTADDARREITPTEVKATIAAGRNTLGHHNFLIWDPTGPTPGAAVGAAR